MANADMPFGFRTVKSGSGGVAGRTTEYPMDSAYATAIGDGDLVKLVAAGTIQLAAAGDAFIGVFRGVRYTDTAGRPVFRRNWVASTPELANTTIVALVEDDPFAIYETQADTATTRASVGQFANLVASAPDSNGGSTMSVVHGGAEVQLQVVDLIITKPVRNAAGNQDMSTTGTFAIVHVRPILHQKGQHQAVLAEV